jgi:hypothetical protein
MVQTEKRKPCAFSLESFAFTLLKSWMISSRQDDRRESGLSGEILDDFISVSCRLPGIL